MMKKLPNLFGYLSICFSCFLLSTGICVLIDTRFDAQVGVKSILIQTLAISAVLTVLLFNRWTAILAVIAGVAGVMYVISALKIGVVGDFSSFINWCMTQMPVESPWYSPENVALTHTFMNSGICLLLFLAARTPYRSRLTVLISLALISLVYAFGFAECDKIVVLFVFSGVLPLCAVDKFENRKHIGGKKNFAVLGKRWVVPLVSLGLCLIISASTLAVFNNDKTYDTRNRTCSDIAADIQSLTGVYTQEQQEVEITLKDLGLQAEDYIGGNLPTLEHRLLAVTDLKESRLLRVTTFDTFLGKSWKNEFQKNYRVNGPFKTAQDRYFSNTVLNGKANANALKNIIHREKVRITLNIDSYFLPTIGQTYGFAENTQTKNPTLFNQTGELFSYFGQEYKYSYTLDSVQLKTDAVLTDTEGLEITRALIKTDPVYTKEFVEQYTQLPKNFKRYIKSFADGLAISNKNPYYIARKVTSYFSEENGFSYTAADLEYENKNNVIDKILKTKKGHCVYYSTTAIALLRHFKIPCRLAAGYRTVALGKTLQIADSFYPYCWVECYFPNLGWVSFDPSPENQALLPMEMPPFEGKSETSKPQIDIPTEGSDNTVPAKAVKIPYKFLYLSVLAVVLYIALRGFWAYRIYSVKIVKKLFGSNEKRCEFYVKDMLRQFALLGFERPSGETLREQVLRVSDTLSEQNRIQLIDSLVIAEEVSYGGKIPDEEELFQLYNTRLTLENNLKKKLNPIIYLVKRKILLPIF